MILIIVLLNHKVNLWSIEWNNLDFQHYFWIQFWWSKSFAVNIININNDSYRCWISNCLNKKFLLFCIRDEQNVAFLYVTNFAQVPDSKKLKLVLDPIKIFQVYYKYTTHSVRCDISPSSLITKILDILSFIFL